MPTHTSFTNLSAACRDASASIAASVVQIQGRPRHPASALVVGPERLATTSHSVEWEEDIAVRADDSQPLTASIAGRDPATDLVLLKVPGLSAPAIRLAERVPETGELGLIVGRTWGRRLKVRLTVLTRLEGPIRVGRGRTLDGVLGLDTGAYTGFSGSAVLLPDGTVAGISTTGLARGAGLALPAAAVKATLDALERDGRVQRGYLGITSQPVAIPSSQRAGLSAEHGLLIVGVADDAPAAAAGLLVGDILVDFDGAPVADPETLLTRLSGDRIGQSVPLVAVRGTTRVDLVATIAARADQG